MAKHNSTRDQILYLLKSNGTMSVSELAQALGVTEMAVRRHLNALERDRFIQSRFLRQPMGRPLGVYSLTEKADQLFPKHYPHLALDLLKDIESLEGESKVDELLERRVKRVREQYEERMQGKSLGSRIEELAHLQDKKGYMVELEKDQASGNILFKEMNCPISQVAKSYKHICRCELNMFRQLLETEVDMLQCMAEGGQHCVYEIKNG